MIALTALETLLRSELVRRAQSADPLRPDDSCITYGELCHQVDPGGASHYPMTRPPFRGINEALGHVSMYEHERGRPLLTSLVVLGDGGHPGGGFAKLGRHLGLNVEDEEAFWRLQLERVVAFWSSQDQVLLIDSVSDRLIDELRTIKGLLRRALES